MQLSKRSSFVFLVLALIFYANRSLAIAEIPPCVSTSSTLTVSACDSFTSASGNATWFTSGTYMDTILNSMGCDSIITYHLSILSGSVSFTLHINAGGPAYTAANGDMFVADQYFLNGSTSTNTKAIANTADDVLYQSERYEDSLEYAIPVPFADTFMVSLYFAETFKKNKAVGKRVFDLSLEGVLVLDDYDIYVDAGGGDTAVVKTYKVYVSDGTLNIATGASVNNAKLNAISIASVSAVPGFCSTCFSISGNTCTNCPSTPTYNTTLPDPILIGSGISNMHMAVMDTCSMNIGIKAHLRFLGDITPTGNTYEVEVGESPVSGSDPTPDPGTARWNALASINLGSYTFEDLLVYQKIDFDPADGAGQTGPYVGNVSQFMIDNGQGATSFFQSSENLGFAFWQGIGDPAILPFDPFATGVYDQSIEVWTPDSILLLHTDMRVVVHKIGCTDPTSITYDSTATKDDGSCDTCFSVAGKVCTNCPTSPTYNDTLPDLILIGSGLSNVHMAVMDTCGMNVGIKAHKRFLGDIVPTGDTYQVEIGESPKSGSDPTPDPGIGRWNYLASVNLGSYTFNDLLVYQKIDFDPADGAGQTDPFLANISQFMIDNALGGTSLYQESQNLGFAFWQTIGDPNILPFDPFATGVYDQSIEVWTKDSVLLLQTNIRVVVYKLGCTNPAAIFTYDSTATKDDGSCDTCFLVVNDVCTSCPSAPNYNDTLPDPILIGSGISNYHMAVMEQCDLNVGIKAMNRFLGDITPTGNTYMVEVGESPVSGSDPTPDPGTARWNYLASINLGAFTFDDLLVYQKIDFDPADGTGQTGPYLANISQFMIDNGQGATSFFQASENLGFGFWQGIGDPAILPFNPFATGVYDQSIEVWTPDSILLLQTDMKVVVYKSGCTDSTSITYDSTATQDDGSCDTCFTVVGGVCTNCPIMPIYDTVLPDPIVIGSGISNMHMAVMDTCGMNVGIKAHERFIGDVVPTGDTYIFDTGESPTSGSDPTPDPGTARWNYLVSVNLGGYTFNDLLVYQKIDFDPADGAGQTGPYIANISQFMIDNALGGTSLYQESQNLGFAFWQGIGDAAILPFDPFAKGVYDQMIEVWTKDSVLLLQADMRVKVERLTCNPPSNVIMTALYDTICDGDSILLGGEYQTNAGTYYDTLQTVEACDSILATKLHITGKPLYELHLNLGNSVNNTINAYGHDFVAELSPFEYRIVGNSNYIGGRSISNTDDDELYWNHVFAYQAEMGDTLQYVFPVGVVDTFCVTLYLAETWSGAYSVGARVFDVILEGDTLIDDLDIFSEVGANAALIKTVNVYVDDGTLNLVGLASANNPQIAAISVVSKSLDTCKPKCEDYYDTTAANICAGDSLMIDGIWRKSSGVYCTSLLKADGCDSILCTNLTVDPYITGTKKDTICPGDSLYLAGAWQTAAGVYYDTLTAANHCDSILATTLCVRDTSLAWFEFHFNLGNHSTDKSFNATNGTYFTSETAFDGYRVYGSSATSLSAGTPIANTLDDTLYWYAVYGEQSFGVNPGPLEYAFPVSLVDSFYVTLYMAETFYSGNNQRVFDIILEGDTLFKDLDIHSEVGKDAALVKSFTVYVDDGTLNLIGSATVSNAQIAGISIVSKSKDKSCIKCTDSFDTTLVKICAGDSVYAGGAWQTTSGIYCDTLLTAAGCDSVLCTDLHVGLLEIVSMDLVEAPSGNLISTLSNGYVINKALIPTDFSIEAIACNGVVKSVVFNVNGSNVRTENVYPYAINGDNPPGVFKEWDPEVGFYTITATPYSQKGGNGAAGTPLQLYIQVIDQVLATDCNGDLGGSAFLNDCNECVGGNTGKPLDFGKDDCGICFGNNADKDCNGDCFGTAVIDSCGECVLGLTGKTFNNSCNIDCNGDINGTAVLDDCGVCTGGNTGITYNADQDCNGECFGTAVIDDCSDCVLGSTGKLFNESCADCNGDPYGTASLDDCGVCSGGLTGITPNANKDTCGVCFGNGLSCAPCQAIQVSDMVLVDAGSNADIATLYNNYVITKSVVGSFNIRADVCYPDSVKSVFFYVDNIYENDQNDAPYAIGGDNKGNYKPWNKAAGTYLIEAIPYSGKNATGTMGVPLSLTIIIQDSLPSADCNGDVGGSAYLNDCNICVGGNTGYGPDEGKDDCGVCNGGNADKDCAGVCFGTAIIDSCGDCVLGTTGNPFNGGCNVDCNGDINGTATPDDCGICSGGLTGVIPNADKDTCGVCFGNGLSCAPCVPNEVTSLTLMNTGFAGPIRVLNDVDTIYKDQFTGFSIRADVCDNDTVSSVRFFLNGGLHKNENLPPYSISGDKNGSIKPWSISAGNYMLTATPYTGNNAAGKTGISKTIDLWIFENSARSAGGDQSDEQIAGLGGQDGQRDRDQEQGAKDAPVSLNAGESLILRVYPNPTTGVITVELVNVAESATLALMDASGKVLVQQALDVTGAYATEQIDLSNYPDGMYMLKLSSGEDLRTRRIVKQ